MSRYLFSRFFTSKTPTFISDELNGFHRAIVRRRDGTLPVIAIPLRGSDVSVMRDPHTFFDSLCGGIARAQHRIVLSSLYIGRGPDTCHILEALNAAISAHPQIQVHFLLDFLRGTRSGHRKHWRKGKKRFSFHREKVSEVKYPASSVSQILPLLIAHPHNVRVSFYHTPDLYGLLERRVPHPLNECMGVQHTKFYCFDEDVLISGANLEDNYFLNRLDRYYSFSQNRLLSDFFCGLAKSVGKFSYELQLDGTLQMNPSLSLASHDDPTFKPKAKDEIDGYVNDFVEKTLAAAAAADSLSTPTDSVALISLQMAQIGIRQDEIVTNDLLEHTATSQWRTIFTSPYFNFPPSYRDVILRSTGDVTILVAAPKANGFFFGKGLLPCIPMMYCRLLKQFFDLGQKMRPQGSLHIAEWFVDGWTYHGKGMWWIKAGDTLPSVTNVGSSNYGVRSVNRDLEAQVTIITESEELRKEMGKEVDNLLANGKAVTAETFQREDYQVKTWVGFLTRWLKTYL
jgi:CDP-diacylglycerol--glycerol-3-phosphate 3-phosphatidyltransferase